MVEPSGPSSYFLVRALNEAELKRFPNYYHIFSFEENFNPLAAQTWMNRNFTWSIYLAIVYIGAVFGLREWMRNRPPLNVTRLMVYWNFGLSIFSFLVLVRCFPEFLYVLQNRGYYHTVCSKDGNQTHKIVAFWYWLVVISKAFELMDTLFLVMRKRKLLVLHWFHHSVTLVFTCYLYDQQAALGRWFTVMNMSIHTVMYAYFALMSLKVKIPRPIAMAITISQITQMMIGAYASFYVFAITLKGESCEVSQTCATLAVLMYLVHFYLFIKLFVDSYLSKKPVVKHD